MTQLFPYRFTCAWPKEYPGPSLETWANAVRMACHINPADFPLATKDSFAQLNHCSVLVNLAWGPNREQRRELSKQLETIVETPICVAITTGEMATEGAKLVVCDADSTLFTCEVIEKVAHWAGTEEQVAKITAAAMRGELDFAQSLTARVSTLKGLDAKVLDTVREQVDFSTGATEMVNAFHRYGTRVGVVSGGFAEIVEPKAASIGLDHVMANRFEILDGKLTGRIAGLIVTGEIKEECLRQWASQDSVMLENTVALGDGANDLPMMKAAGLGVAYCAKPIVSKQADARIPFANLAAAADLAGPTSTVI